MCASTLHTGVSWQVASLSDPFGVEVIAVGTELLLGQIVNTNLATIGAALAEAGLDSYHQVVVGDNLERLAAEISASLERTDAVILTGGIGPTQDDLTREGICAATGLEMTYSEEYARHLEDWWASRGREMPATNYKQAEHPAGARLIENKKGTAPGLDTDLAGTPIFALPGVPAAMAPMLAAPVIPALVALQGGDLAALQRRVRRILRFLDHALVKRQPGKLAVDIALSRRKILWSNILGVRRVIYHIRCSIPALGGNSAHREITD